MKLVVKLVLIDQSIKQACETRKQLAGYLGKLGLPLASCGRDSKALRHCITGAFFCNAAKLESDGSCLTRLNFFLCCYLNLYAAY